jgi:alpha-amylase
LGFYVSFAGDFFHAAPNIDHSQAFVRKDIKEWMKWLRHDFQFDGWRLDFVRSTANLS